MDHSLCGLQEAPKLQSSYPGVVGLLQFLLVNADLLFVLSSQLDQSCRQLVLKLLLSAAVDLHHPRLGAPLGLACLLQGGVQTQTAESQEHFILDHFPPFKCTVNTNKRSTCTDPLQSINLIVLISQLAGPNYLFRCPQLQQRNL